MKSPKITYGDHVFVRFFDIDVFVGRWRVDQYQGYYLNKIAMLENKYDQLLRSYVEKDLVEEIKEDVRSSLRE